MFYVLIIWFLLNSVQSENQTNNLLSIKWVSSNFGSSFSALPCFYDINHDGFTDLITTSVDGEIICYDLITGESLINSNWPVYIANDHFFSKPLIYIFGENYNQELILIISQKGVIYSFDWKGILINTFKIDNIYLHKNWSFINFKSLHELIEFNLAGSDSIDLFHELYPEIYANGIIIDLNQTGVVADVIIPVNFVSRRLDRKDVVLSAVVVVNLVSRTTLTVFPLKISLKVSESPGYLLTDIDVLDSGTYQIIVTSTSGIIYKLVWDKAGHEFRSVFDDSLIYNIGPNKCHLTEFCRGSDNNTFVSNGLCCIYIDYYSHMAVMDLTRFRSMWEYEFRDGGVATETEIFVDESSINDGGVYAIFGTSTGLIHCVSLSSGQSNPLFPLSIKKASFHSKPNIVHDLTNRVFLLFLSNEGKLYQIPMNNPKEWIILIQNDQISSYLSPIILPSNKRYCSDIIIQSKSGFIFKYELINLMPQKDKYSKTVMNSVSPGQVSTLFGLGSKFSFDLQIYNPSSVVLDSKGYYVIKIFVNEYLYKVQKVWHYGKQVTESQIIIDLQALDRDLIPQSVFLFGTVSVRVTNHIGQSFLIDYFYVRINYDFQFELIWIVYLTFIICILTLLTLHFYNDNHKFFIPLYEYCDKK